MNAPLLPGRIEHWPLARLKPYARNAKTHDADQVAKIAASMAEFGWTVPVLVAADGELIAGHGRVLAAAHLGLAEAPVIVLGHLTEAQRRAYRIADNKLLWLPPVVQGVFAPFAHVIDCELLSGLWVQPCQKLLAGMVIRGSGPNLTAGLDRPQLVPGFPDPDLFDHYAHSGRRSLTPPVPASRRWSRRAVHAAPAGTGSL